MEKNMSPFLSDVDTLDKIKLRGRKGLGEGLMTDGLGHFALAVYGFALPQGRMLIDAWLMLADSLITESMNQKPIEVVARQRARERTIVWKRECPCKINISHMEKNVFPVFHDVNATDSPYRIA